MTSIKPSEAMFDVDMFPELTDMERYELATAVMKMHIHYNGTIGAYSVTNFDALALSRIILFSRPEHTASTSSNDHIDYLRSVENFTHKNTIKASAFYKKLVKYANAAKQTVGRLGTLNEVETRLLARLFICRPS